MLQRAKTIVLILVGCILAEVNAQSLSADGLPSLKGRNVLLVYGGWDGHQPKIFVERVAAWLKTEGVSGLTISDSLGVYTNEKLMAETDLIIQYWTMGKISKEQEAGLLKAVKNGTGLAGCHGGLGDSFRENTDYQYMVGGQWVAHPGGKIDYKVDITNTKDPITKGLTDFNIKNTEQYYMHVDPNSQVLATTTFNGAHDSWIEGAVMPVSWKKYYAKGRVFYLSIGHDPIDFDTPSAWKLLTRGIRWASGSKYFPKENTLKPVYPSTKVIKK
ncbi:MAG: ThuA domain-containing protein [Cyclobacteriaceae bacterium]